MILDWVTCRLERSDCPHWGGWNVLSTWGERIVRYCPKTGQVIWETDAWESVRSDSHQIAVRVQSDVIWVQGSPGRVMGDGDTVFSEAVGLDLLAAVMAMIDFVSTRLPCGKLPEARLWRVSKIDVTENYIMSSLADVRVALATLRGTEGGRYRVSQQAGDTVYWSHRSRLRSGKAYAKGPHLRYLMRKRDYTGRQYSEIEIENAKSKLVRKNLDCIVLNSLQDKGAGFQKNTNKISIIDKFKKITEFSLKSKAEVAADIFNTIIPKIHV